MKTATLIRKPSTAAMCDAGYCPEIAILDFGMHVRCGFPREVRFLCAKHGRPFHPETRARCNARRKMRKSGRCPDCGGALVGTYPTAACPSCENR